MRYYVYALIDPTNDNTPFYIGKGIDNRVKSHFKEALSVAKTDTESEEDNEVDIGIIAENVPFIAYKILEKARRYFQRYTF